ncbi:MAG: DHH family phosphoesterase [archaeon]
MEVLQVLRESTEKNILLLAHHNADPDAVCSAIALSEGLKQIGCKSVRIGFVESISKLSQKIVNKLNYEIDLNPNLNADLIVLLDTSTAGQLSKMADKFKSAKAEKIIIDHHTPTEEPLEADHKLVDEKASSTVELVYDLLKELGVEISKEVAEAMCFGLVAETAHLQFATPKVFRILADLQEKHGIVHQDILELLRTQVDVSEKIAHFKAAGRTNVTRVKNYLIVTTRVGSFEASCARALMRMGADLAAVSSKPDELRISMRSSHSFLTETGIDLGRDIMPGLIKIIDGTGSGHPTAAGANGNALDKEKEAMAFIVSFVQNKLENQHTLQSNVCVTAADKKKGVAGK